VRSVLDIRLPERDSRRVEEFLTKRLSRTKRDGALWSFEGEGTHITYYPSEALLIGGKKAHEWKERILSLVEEPSGPVCGCDESGKGDVFGPLVFACAVIVPKNYKKILEQGPRDSKAIPTGKLLEKTKKLRSLVPVKTIALYPERLNELYPRYGNLNRLMDEAYGKLLREIEHFKPAHIVIDRYSPKNPFGGSIEFIEKGEKDVAVSVASMFARARFLTTLSELSRRYGIELPRGANTEALSLARELTKKDPELARKLVKLFFKL